MDFPIDLSAYRPLGLHLSQDKLTPEQNTQLQTNIQLVRDSIVFFTALSNAKGLGGHTGGAYDIVPEVLIVDSLMRQKDGFVHPVLFDAAGHRVAIQYMMAALDGALSLEDLLHYREHRPERPLPGHPELGLTPGIKFSSGRLGHLWSQANGIAEAHPGKSVVVFSSDGCLQEGTDAEAARYAVANRLDVKLIVDDNDTTIEGHTSKYMPGFDIEKTLSGHGLKVRTVKAKDESNFGYLYYLIKTLVTERRPGALIIKRSIAPGVSGIEGSTKGHDAIPVDLAINYLESKDYDLAAEILRGTKKIAYPVTYLGSSKEFASARTAFGDAVCEALENKVAPERVLVVSNDLGGSTGLAAIAKKYPGRYRTAGPMERNNFSVAAGFGSIPGNQGIYATFSVFSEMINSEISMARLNGANVLAHFSHAGVDDMSDNTCHFGINTFFVDNGLPEGDETRLYFPADAHQMKAVVRRVISDPGLRFIFSTRSTVPYILDERGSPFFGPDYKFEPGKDEVIREGKDGWIVSYGDMLYRSLDAVERLRAEGIQVGLLNKPTLNVADEEKLDRIVGEDSPFVLVVESQNRRTGLGSRFGTWLLERGLTPRYAHMGVTHPGAGGQAEQIAYQGLSPEYIMAKARELHANS